MIVHDVEQGSAEWFALKRGIVSASVADQIVTPVKCELSKSARKLAYRLIAERLLNTTLETVAEQEWILRGRELEPRAVAHYEFVNGAKTERVGFVTTDDGLIGASPDRFLEGRRAGLEVKAPAPHTHIQYLLEGPGDAYKPQVQTQLMVCDSFEFVDFLSYSDRAPQYDLRTYRDEDYIKRLRAAITEFNERMFAMLARAKSLGAFQPYESAATPLERERAGLLSAEMLDAFGLPP